LVFLFPFPLSYSYLQGMGEAPGTYAMQTRPAGMMTSPAGVSVQRPAAHQVVSPQGQILMMGQRPGHIIAQRHGARPIHHQQVYRTTSPAAGGVRPVVVQPGMVHGSPRGVVAAVIPSGMPRQQMPGHDTYVCRK
jgi:hypothetical protein